jgi:pilus assembly protein Flp/PilA
MLVETIRSFNADETGATAIEYGLLATLIAIALVATLGVVGDNLVNLMHEGTGSAAEVIAAQSEKL